MAHRVAITERAVQRTVAGLAAPRLLEAGLGGCRLAWSGSVDGGLEKLDEFRLRRASRAATPRSNKSTRLRMAA